MCKRKDLRKLFWHPKYAKNSFSGFPPPPPPPTQMNNIINTSIHALGHSKHGGNSHFHHNPPNHRNIPGAHPPDLVPFPQVIPHTGWTSLNPHIRIWEVTPHTWQGSLNPHIRIWLCWWINSRRCYSHTAQADGRWITCTHSNTNCCKLSMHRSYDIPIEVQWCQLCMSKVQGLCLPVRVGSGGGLGLTVFFVVVAIDIHRYPRIDHGTTGAPWWAPTISGNSHKAL